MDAFSTGTPPNNYQKQHLALRVALDTMKDRCILQQKRLSEVEEENQQLRERLIQSNKPSGNASHNAGGVAENFQLRLQVSELQRQNGQLNAHINMVSAENRKLWQRLSQMAKEQSKPVIDKDATLRNTSSDGIIGDEVVSPNGTTAASSFTNQNLIRSKTFTQHSPNPNLRHKLLPSENSGSTELLDVSLEADVAIEALGSSSDKPQFGVENDSNESQTDMGFGYLNVEDTSPNSSPQEHDFNLEARKCIEGLQEMRREAVKQQHDLNTVFTLLESRIALQPCPECIKKSNKPEMADKSLETDESFNDAVKYENSTTNGSNTASVDPVTKVLQNNHLNIIQEKILADERNNICPMCGNIYGSQVSFESFCEHVEEHFRDENLQDTDHNMEHNFEFISHTVGDF